MDPQAQDTNASSESQPAHGCTCNPMMMDMMKKMMSQMGSQSSGEVGNPMQQMMGMCMSMCSQMLTTIHRTTSMAAFATPELHTLFGEWMENLEREALAVLDDQGEADADVLAAKLNISEASAIHLIAHLAGKGKVSLNIYATGQGES